MPKRIIIKGRPWHEEGKEPEPIDPSVWEPSEVVLDIGNGDEIRFTTEYESDRQIINALFADVVAPWQDKLAHIEDIKQRIEDKAEVAEDELKDFLYFAKDTAAARWAHIAACCRSEGYTGDDLRRIIEAMAKDSRNAFMAAITPLITPISYEAAKNSCGPDGASISHQ